MNTPKDEEEEFDPFAKQFLDKDHMPIFPWTEIDANVTKAKPRRKPVQFSESILRHRQGWADFFQESAEIGKKSKKYCRWVSALWAGACFGDELALLKLQDELKRLAKKEPLRIYESVNLGHCYLSGVGRKKDLNEAVEVYRRMSHAHLSNGHFSLGMCYIEGIEVEKDMERGLSLLRRAKDQGNINARYQLALLHFMGEEGSRDLHFCFHEFLAMAQEGCNFACTLVGLFYLYGIAVPKDQRMAEGYLSHGIKSGYSVDKLGDKLGAVVEDLIMDAMDLE